ncbi:MAG: TonB-dependent receptor [Arenimonas sp.]|nr:TonB-dependent receptor [Arenimonas sp.]
MRPISPERQPLPAVLACGILLTLYLPVTHANAAPEPAVHHLDKVVVTAAGFEQAIREAPASISIITREQLEAKPYHGLAEALADVEGVDIGDAVDKTGAPSISIRGMPSDYTLLLIDGRRQNAAGNVTPNNFGSTANNFIPPLSAIERIEVIRGPMSTLYGSDAMGGVVNIITRKPRENWGGSLGLDATLQQNREFGDMASANFYLNGPLAAERAGLALWGGVFHREPSDVAYETQTGGEVTPIMGANPVNYTNHNLGLRFSLAPNENHDLWLEATASRQNYDNDNGQLGTLGSGGYAESQRYQRQQATLAWDARFGIGAWQSSLMRSRTETIGRLIPPGVSGAGGPRRLETVNTVFDGKLVTALGAHTLSVGGQYWWADMVDGVAPTPFEFNQWALFAEDEWRLRDDLALTTGLRRDEHSSFGGHNSPRAYLVWNAADNWVLKGGVSRGYKTPRLEQLTDGINGFGGQGRIPLIGTPGLKPETSTSAEIGLHYARDGGVSASASLFHNRFRDKIATGVPVFNCSYALSPDRPGCVDVGNWPSIDTFGQSVNIDEAVTRGLELTANAPLGRGLRWSGSYTRTDSEQKSGAAAGQPLTNTPEHMLNTALEWDGGGRLSLFLRGEYRSERYRGAGLAQDQLGDYRAYDLFHVGGQYRIREGVRLHAAVYNLLDRDFVDYRPYVSNTATGAVSYANTYVNSEDGRRLWLSLAMDF